MMTTKRTLMSLSAALVLLGSTVLVACGGGPDKVDSPVDQAPTADPVADPNVPTDPVTEGVGGGVAEDPKTDGAGTEEATTDEKEGEVKPDEAAKEGEAAKE